jgi:hypothetical protein
MKTKCKTCLNSTLATMSHKKTENTAFSQSSDLPMLTTLQVSKDTSTLWNNVIQSGKIVSHVHMDSFLIVFSEYFFSFLRKLENVDSKRGRSSFYIVLYITLAIESNLNKHRCNGNLSPRVTEIFNGTRTQNNHKTA